MKEIEDMQKKCYHEAFQKGYRFFSQKHVISFTPEEIYDFEQEFEQSFFFMTNDQKETKIALGALKDYHFPHFDSLKQKQQRIKKDFFTDEKLNKGLVFVGAFPFDSSVVSPQWHHLGQGYFFLPQWLYSKKQQSITLWHNFYAQSIEELEKKLKENPFLKTKKRAKKEQLPHTMFVEELQVNKWLAYVKETIEQIQKENFQKVVVARQLKVTSETSFCPSTLLYRLKKQQKNTYFFALRKKHESFIGATPERLLKANHTSFSSACIAGSIRSGKTKEETKQLGERLLHSSKNRKEHKIVVDRVCYQLQKIVKHKITYETPQLLINREIQHLYIPMSGKRKKDISFLNALQLLHPTPALGGEPKKEALRWIKEKEQFKRGLYGAPIGWFDVEDNGEMVVGIRSGLFQEKIAYLFAGCGIVSSSNPKEEREETKVKFQPMLKSMGVTWK